MIDPPQSPCIRDDVDIVVIGAGPAGIAAASRAAECGRRVILLDEAPQAGGQIWRHRTGDALPAVASRWLQRLEQSGAQLLSGTSVVDVHALGTGGFSVVGESSSASREIHAASIVVATGARERFIPFPGWTLPGVYGIGGAQALHKQGVSFAGKRVVIAGSGPLLFPVAASLSQHGAKVVLVAEQAPARAIGSFVIGLWRRPDTIAQAVRYRARFRGTPYRAGTWIRAAYGDGRVESVSVTNGAKSWTIECDVLCSGYGLVPNTQVPRLIGCRVSDGAVKVDTHLQTSVSHVYSAGEVIGIGGVDLAVIEGELAGLAAAGSPMDVELLRYRRASLRPAAARMERSFALRDDLREIVTQETIVCRCEDVRFGALDRTWGTRQAKLYTRVGMGACQGRVCGASLEFLCGWSSDSAQVPSEPARLSTLLGA